MVNNTGYGQYNSVLNTNCFEMQAGDAVRNSIMRDGVIYNGKTVKLNKEQLRMVAFRICSDKDLSFQNIQSTAREVLRTTAQFS